MMARPDRDGGHAGALKPEALRRLANLGLTSAGLAHDMGNLLQVIASALHLIERKLTDSGPSEMRVLCQNARSAVDRIVTLRGQILDLARTEPAVSAPVHPGALIDRLRGLIALTLGPQIDFEVDCAQDAPFVVCDAQDLENVIFNLLLNARDAMPDGGRLRLSVRREVQAWSDPGVVAGQAPRAVIRVVDTGCGMSADTLGRALTPFFTTKPSGQGTGLGLAMVADFARRAGGVLALESEPGEGTTVVLSLPAA